MPPLSASPLGLCQAEVIDRRSERNIRCKKTAYYLIHHRTATGHWARKRFCLDCGMEHAARKLETRVYVKVKGRFHLLADLIRWTGADRWSWWMKTGYARNPDMRGIRALLEGRGALSEYRLQAFCKYWREMMERAPKEFLVVVRPCPPGLNQLLRMHWAKRRLIFEDVYRQVEEQVPQVLRVGVKSVILEATRYASRKADPDNAFASLKAVIDGLVKAGVIWNDSGGEVTLRPIKQKRSTRAESRMELLVRVVEP